MKYQEIQGDLIKLAQEGKFDVIAHGCNCFCTMRAGIATQFVKAFHTDKFPQEHPQLAGKIEKLGNIDGRILNVFDGVAYIPENAPKELIFKTPDFELIVVNAYTQYYPGKNSPGCNIPLDYTALQLCFRKMNHIFKGKHIGLPKIGCGLAKGNWELVSELIQYELFDCDVTVVIYDK